MNSTDKIREFFQQRLLQDTTPMEADWNVPSDEIWNKAKVHFPKKKNKRRPFLYILFGVGLLVSIGLTRHYANGGEPNTDSEKIATDVNSQADNGLHEEQPILTKDKVIKLDQQTPTDEAFGHTNDQLNTATRLDATLPQSQKLEQERIFNSTEISTLGSVSDGQIKAEKEVDRREEIENKKLENEQELDYNLNRLNRPDGAIETKFVETIAPSENIEVEGRMFLEPEFVPTLRQTVIRASRSELTGINLWKVKPQRKLNKWEIGLSYAPFILLPDDLFAEEETAQQQTSIGLKYSTFSLPISRRLSSRYSLSSGLYFSNLDLDLNFTVEDVYKKDLTKRKLQTALRDNAATGSLTINDASRDVTIDFTKDANLQNGDTVLLKAGIPIQMNVVQVPLILNYHFGKGKIEGLLHGGISIDFFKARISDLDFKVFKDGKIINEPVDFEPLEEAEVFGGIYLGAGIKYHLNDRFNLGLSTKIDVASWLLSRYEFGVYYGF